MNFSLNFNFFLKSFLKPGSLEERLKLHNLPENAIKWPYTNSFDQDLTNQSEQADRDTPFFADWLALLCKLIFVIVFPFLLKCAMSAYSL